MRLLKLSGVLLPLVLAACAGRPDYETFYAAEQGDYEAALSAAESAQGNLVNGWLFGTGTGACRDYNSVITVLVAKNDFRGARETCADFEAQCAVDPASKICFSYELSQLDAASGDAELAKSLSDEAREALHFRWLMIQDDYEGNPLKRPIF